MGSTLNATTLQDAAQISYVLAMKWLGPLTAAMAVAEINTAERKAMFIAQCGHESGGFASVEESLNYTPRALTSTWPQRFSVQLAQVLGRTPDRVANQQQIARVAYGGRMGNAPAPSDDGWDHRGRGLIQVTGKDNYEAFWKWLGRRESPEDLAKPELAALSAAWFWQTNKLNKWADLKDVDTASRVINLGSSTTKAIPNGLEDRRSRYRIALAVMTGRK